MTILTRSETQYTKQYCEENIYLLSKQLLAVDPTSNALVVFISNERRAVPLWAQSASRDDSTLVIWDYHVILINQTASSCIVYDFDALLPFPCLFHKYVDAAFKPNMQLLNIYQRQFRVVPAVDYVKHFSSDRSHMIDKVTKAWLAPPPDYPPLISNEYSERVTNLDAYIDMRNTTAQHFGQVYSEDDFLALFQSTKKL